MNLTTPTASDIQSFYDRGKYTLAWRFTLIFSLVFALLSLTFINSTNGEYRGYVLFAIISFSSLIYLSRTKNFKPIYYFATCCATVVIMYTINYLPVVHFGDFLWMILTITIAFFGLGIKAGVFFLVLNVGNMIYYGLFSINSNFEAIAPLDWTDKIALAIELTTATLSIIYIIYQFLTFHQHSYNGMVIANKELVHQNKIISAQNIENGTLVKEIHHRVKNNLQIVISLLRLQKSELKSEEAQNHFTEAINRIMVMSLIHKKLYQEGALATIELQAYLEDLADDINSLSNLEIPVEFIIDTKIDIIGLKTIVPLGLIINELISNSMRHAFKEKLSGKIEITLEAGKGKKMILTYHDNGKWYPPSSGNTSFGLELLDIISQQLEGYIDRESSDTGTKYVLELMNIDDDEST